MLLPLLFQQVPHKTAINQVGGCGRGLKKQTKYLNTLCRCCLLPNTTRLADSLTD